MRRATFLSPIPSTAAVPVVDACHCDDPYAGSLAKWRLYRDSLDLVVTTSFCSDRVARAVEVKSSRQVRPEDLRALENFSEDYPQSRRYLLYRGKRLKRNGVMCLPCEEFLLALTPDHFPE
jgi:hypothetical protein